MKLAYDEGSLETPLMTLPIRPKAYRPCVGLVIFNQQGKAFMGKRGDLQPQMQGVQPWQFPQGGIEKNERIIDAAKRELHEETGLREARLIGFIPDWLSYDLPTEIIGSVLHSRFCGQKQIWLAMQMTLPDSAIALENDMTDVRAEFIEWEWVSLSEAAKRIVPFKHEIYDRLVRDFSSLADKLAKGIPLPEVTATETILDTIPNASRGV